MSALMIALTIFAIMLLLMAIRIPIAVAMFGAGAFGYIMQSGWLPFASFLNTLSFARFASYDLSVIPLFILMGNFATQGGISKALLVRSRHHWPVQLLGRFVDLRWRRLPRSPAWHSLR